MYRLTHFDIVMLLLLVIGGINWGLVGLLEFDLVAFLFGGLSILTKITYSVVGLSALYTLFIIYKLKLM